MEPTTGILIGVLGLFAALFGRTPRIQMWIIGLATLGISCELISGFEPDQSLQLIHYSLVAVNVFALIASLINWKYAKYLGVIVSLFAFLPIGAKATYFGFEIVWSLNVSILVFAGACVPILSDIIAKFGKKIAGADEQPLRVASTLFMIGILVFYSIFQASYFGVFLIGLGGLATAIASRSILKMAVPIGIITIAWALYVSKSSELMPDALLRGNLFMGIIVGIGLIYWSKAFVSANRFKFFYAVIFPVLVSLFVIALGKINPNFGGIPTFVGVLVGLSLACLTVVFSKSDSKNATFLALPFILIGFTGSLNTWLTPPKLETKTLLIPQPISESINTTAPVDVLEIPTVQLDDSWEGTWKSVSANSKVEFELGPDGGKTQGAITEAEVSIKLDKEGNPAQLNVKMKTENVTTFNDLRDESILGEGYLNAAKHPKITYSSSKIVKQNDRYIIEGSLDFLGIKQAVSLEAKIAAKGDKNGKKYVVLVGKSVVDRTTHGMDSDSKIGDLVHVKFEIAFQ